MDVEREIQYGCPGRQYPQFSGRGEYEDFPRRRLWQVVRIRRELVLEIISDGSQPFVHCLLVLDAFVGPMGGVAVLRDVIHPLRPDLDFDVGILPVPYRDVQGFISVRLRVRYPVAQPFGIGLVFLCHIGIYLPAQVLLHGRILLAVNDEPDSEHVEDAFERHFLLLHFFVDGICSLRADFQLVPDAGHGKFLLERPDEFLGQLDAVFLGGFQLVGDKAVLGGVRKSEIYVLKFALDVVESQLVGQGDVKHQGFEDFPLPRCLREYLEVAHYLEPVGNLDDRHPRVSGILHNELLVALGFEAGVFRLYGGYLVQPVHYLADLGRELGFPDVESRMLPPCLMQEYCGGTFRRQANLVRHDESHVHRMLDERMSVVPGVRGQCLCRYVQGFLQKSFPLFVIVRELPVYDFLQFEILHKQICQSVFQIYETVGTITNAEKDMEWKFLPEIDRTIRKIVYICYTLNFLKL